MNLVELYNLTKWVEHEITSKGLPKKYQQLHNILNQNAQPNQQQSPFEDQKNELIKAIGNIGLLSLTKDQMSFLDNLEILPALGNDGISQVEDILFRNAIDTATAAQKIQDIHNRLNEGIRKLKLISDGLQGCVEEDEHEEDEEALIRVSFLGEASISNVKDFKEWGTKWHDIGRGIAMAHNAAPEDVKITGAAKGSVIIELMTDPAIATTVSAIIWGALKVTEKVQDIRKKSAEIKNLNLQNDKISQELQASAEQEKEAGITKIVNDQTVALNFKEGGGDKVNSLEKAIRTLVDFIDRGGEVDFVVPEEEESEEETQTEDAFAKIRETTQEIRAIEERLRLIEDNTEE